MKRGTNPVNQRKQKVSFSVQHDKRARQSRHTHPTTPQSNVEIGEAMWLCGRSLRSGNVAISPRDAAAPHSLLSPAVDALDAPIDQALATQQRLEADASLSIRPRGACARLKPSLLQA